MSCGVFCPATPPLSFTAGPAGRIAAGICPGSPALLYRKRRCDWKTGWDVTRSRIFSSGPSRCETSYALSPAYRGAGLMPEALGAVLRFGFAQAGFNRICAEVLAGNAASVRVLEKCGFRREGILRRRYRKDGCFVDAWLYAVLSSEFSDQSK